MPHLAIIAPRTPTDVRVGRRAWAWLRKRVRGTELEITGAHVELHIPWHSVADLSRALDVLTAWNVVALRAKPLPRLYDSGVRYAREPKCRSRGVERICEEWLTAHEVLRRGQGDCDDLGGWRAGELRRTGVRALARPIRSPVGFHIVVRYRQPGRGRVLTEDPSKRLGMKGG